MIKTCIDFQYSAVIRTDRYDALLEQAVDSLRRQSLPPAEIIFVDSSKDAECFDRLGKLGSVVLYPSQTFNFSKAINLGVNAAKNTHALVISSHVLLLDLEIIEKGVGLMQDNLASVVYWCGEVHVQPGYEVVSAKTFDGRNGLSNSCSMLPVDLVRERGFREEVFSAEDQEWASWYLRKKHGKIIRVDDPGFSYQNPRINALKTINEEISIAYFSYRRNLWPDMIFLRLIRSLVASVRMRPHRARMHFEIAKGLFFAWFSTPVRNSRYF